MKSASLFCPADNSATCQAQRQDQEGGVHLTYSKGRLCVPELRHHEQF